MTESRHASSNHANDWQDQIGLLVERELSGREREDLIQLLDRHPERWRACALAFMERDALWQSLRQIQNGGDTGSAVRLAVSGFGPADQSDCLDAAGAALAVPSHQVTSPITAPSPLTQRKRLRWSVALPWSLAGVLLALFVFTGERTPNISRQYPSQLHPAVAERESSDSQPLAVGESDPEVWLQVRSVVNQLSVADSRIIALVDIGRQGDSSEIVPIIHSATLTQQIAGLPKPDLPREYVDQVHRAGWQCDIAHQFLSFHYPDGRNHLLPVATHNYRYVGREVF